MGCSLGQWALCPSKPIVAFLDFSKGRQEAWGLVLALPAHTGLSLNCPAASLLTLKARWKVTEIHEANLWLFQSRSQKIRALEWSRILEEKGSWVFVQRNRAGCLFRATEAEWTPEHATRIYLASPGLWWDQPSMTCQLCAGTLVLGDLKDT